MSSSAPRRAALEVIFRVRERNAYAHETLDAVLRSANLESRDAGLATRLAYGAVAARGTLDEAIARVTDEGTRLEPRVADALALGAYEVLFAGTPPHAAVSETVELVRDFNPRAAGLANAVMRRIARATDAFPWGDPAKDNAALARLYAHPRWLAELWIAELGREAASAVMAADNEPAPLYLAVLDREALPAAESALITEGAEPVVGPLPGSIVVGKPSIARSSQLLASGQAIVMDAGAQLAAHAARPQPGAVVVDIGAGRGGKSLLLASLARAAGGPAERVEAVDIHAFKLDALSRAAERAGYAEVRAVVGDATAGRIGSQATELADASANVVLVDAPCTGLGTLRRHPDRRWRAKSSEIEAMATLGSRLIERASRLVKPGGFMVYSTCTIARRENAEVIDGFLGSGAGRGFAVDALGDTVPEELARFLTPEGYFQSLPEVGGPDGHFIARLVRA